MILDDASVVVNGVDLSDHVQSVELTLGRETQDDTAMGHDARTNAAGLKVVESCSITFHQDFAAGEVDATIWPLYDNKTSHTVVIKPTSAAVGATNPTYTLTGYVSSYPPIGGSVGDQHTTSVSWVNGSATGVARATA